MVIFFALVAPLGRELVNSFLSSIIRQVLPNIQPGIWQPAGALGCILLKIICSATRQTRREIPSTFSLSQPGVTIPFFTLDQAPTGQSQFQLNQQQREFPQFGVSVGHGFGSGGQIIPSIYKES